MESVVVPDDFPSILSGTAALKRLEQHARVMVYTNKASTPEELIQRLQGAKVAVNIRAYSKFDEPLLKACPDLKMIAVLWADEMIMKGDRFKQQGRQNVTTTETYEAVIDQVLAEKFTATSRTTAKRWHSPRSVGLTWPMSISIDGKRRL